MAGAIDGVPPQRTATERGSNEEKRNRRRNPEDPEYDPIPAALVAAKIPGPVYRFAASYIHADGWFGPFTVADLLDESSAEDRGLTPETLALCDTRDKCLSVLAAVASEIGDYVETCYAEDEDGNEIEEETSRVDSRAIVDDIFGYVREIYGDSVLRFA